MGSLQSLDLIFSYLRYNNTVHSLILCLINYYGRKIILSPFKKDQRISTVKYVTYASFLVMAGVSHLYICHL